MPAAARRPRHIALAATLLAAAGWSAAAATATPVASTPEQAATQGRVFAEPSRSTNYTQFAPATGEKEFAVGTQLLQRLYPRYLRATTVAAELGEPLAVSTGPDGIPAGRAGDTKDGRPFDVLELTDRTVPDSEKRYAAVMFAHSAEACGREGVIRGVEDLLRGTADPSITFTDGVGAGGRHTLTSAEILRRTKIFVVSSSPDGWAAGDLTGRYQQNTSGGLNSNRVAWQKGWVFATKELADRGYKTATEAEGLAVGRYFDTIRAKELGGRPFTTAADFHGPLPTALILEHDGGSPARLLRMPDLGQRAEAALKGAFARYASDPGSAAYQGATEAVDTFRKASRAFGPGVLDPIGGLALPGNSSGLNATYNTVGDYPTTWATASGVVDGIGYTASSTWGGFLQGEMGSDTLTFEVNCSNAAPFNPATQQLYADNARAGLFTTLVQAAAGDRTVTQRDLGGRVGFYDDGTRVTDADGNPQPVPGGFPGAPLLAQMTQRPYDVSQTDYFRALPEITVQRPREVTPKRLKRSLASLRTLVVADQEVADPAALDAWVRAGGNLVLTDSALRLLPTLGVGTKDDVVPGKGYVGYTDFVRGDEPFTRGISRVARQTFDPVGLGFPLLMERDGYWQCKPGERPDCASGTVNSAPLWSIDRKAVEAVPGARVLGTIDPPARPTATREGTGTRRASLAVIPHGEGRITAFGAVLPRPTEEFPHFFGLDAYTLSPTAQELLLRAMTVPGRPAPPAARLTRRRLSSGRLRLALEHPRAGTTAVRFLIGRRTVKTDRHAPFAATVRLRRSERRARSLRLRATMLPSGRALTRTLATRHGARATTRRQAAARSASTAGTGSAPVVRSTRTDPAARAYGVAMLMHHEQGVTIARAALTRTRREAVRILALRMLVEQREESSYLRAMLAAWGADPAPHMADREAMGMASPTAVERLRAARGRAADRRFVAVMTEHHRGAIAMSEQALERTAQLDVNLLARGVLNTQRQELAMLRALRTSEGQRAPLAGAAGF